VTLLAAMESACGVFGYHVYRLPSGGMEPTIAKGASLIVRNLSAEATLPASTIVVFRSPDDPDVLWVKRVVAVGGQTVAMHKARLSLDGRPMTERYLPTACVPEDDLHSLRFKSIPELHDFGPVSLADDELFVIGDNRDNSRDSRSYGAIKRSSVVGWVVRAF
jgi:signal peptidase I